FAARYHRAALDAGLLLRPIGATLYVMPPYVLTESDERDLADGLVQVLDQVLDEIAALPATVPNTTPGADTLRMA
nr:adenosylmethionine--8-amino-7-oxononanoate aminotransferase BioA [Aquabacterium sp.]